MVPGSATRALSGANVGGMQRRNTWLVGGIGLIICGIIGLLRDSVMGMPPAGLIITVLADLVWAAAILVFAIGFNRESSVVARKPLGLTALGVVALWPLTSTLGSLALEGLLPPLDEGWMIWGYIAIVVPVLAGLIAVVQIARAGAVPPPWNRAPLVALLIQVVCWLVPQFLVIAMGPANTQLLASLFLGLGMLSFLTATFGLGITATMLASRARSETVEVFRSAAT